MAQQGHKKNGERRKTRYCIWWKSCLWTWRMESVKSEQMCLGEKFQKRYEDERQCDEKKGRGLGSETDLALYSSLSLCVFEHVP